MLIDERRGKAAETQFRVLETRSQMALVEARPLTGRTHQIRVHLALSGCPVLGDALYGKPSTLERSALGLRAVSLAYHDPFTGQPVRILAGREGFLATQGFA